MKSNIKNRTLICHDNLEVLQGINSDCIDLIYLDPPFNKKKIFTAPIKTVAEGASFRDIFRREDIKEEWAVSIKEDNPALYELLDFANRAEGRKSYNFCYLSYMSIRLLEVKRILKDTGSVYLHCDYTMSHYLKLALDCIFGEKSFSNEIIWCYKSGGASSKRFSKKHDVIFFYTKSNQYTFNTIKEKSYMGIGYSTGNKNVTLYDDKDGLGPYTLVNTKDWWDIPILATSSKDRTGYRTQKPLNLLEKIIKSSSNKGDIVLDPFCGCATTCVAAEKLGRQWIGIDISHKAYVLVKQRLTKEATGKQIDGLKDNAVDLYWDQKINYKTNPPKRTDLGKDNLEEHKYVYIISHKKYPGEYKVGIAKNWKLRLNSYQTADPDRSYNMEFKHKTNHYREIEKYIHKIFPNKHEWVQADLRLIKKEIQKADDFH